MRIAFVYDAIYPWVKGGAEKRIYELGKLLSARGNEVHLFGIKWWDGADIIEHEGMILHGVCGQRDLYVNNRRSVGEAVIFSIGLLPHLVRERFDIIDVSVFPYFSCFSVKAVSFLRQTPAVFTWHEFWGDYWYEYMGKMGFFGNIIEKMVLAASPNNVAVSGMTKNLLESNGCSPDKVKLIQNGIDLNEINDIQPQEEESDILFAGRLIEDKHADVLLEAIAEVRKEIPDIRLTIIGDGPDKERIVELAKTLKIENNVEMCGFLEYDEVIARMKASKIFVLPSSREGFGIVVIEAFACSTPVITVNAKKNAAQYLIDDSCGIVTELDPSDIGKAIRELLTKKQLLQKMSRGAKKISERYDWKIVAEDALRYYTDICDPCKSA